MTAATISATDLVDIEAIRQLKSRYFRLMDQKRWNEWRDVFTEDVRIDCTDDGSAVINGRDNFVEFLMPVLADVITVHHGHMPEITITGTDSARGIWSMEDHLEWPPGSPFIKLWGTGWYEEEYRRGADGQWRIHSLKLKRRRIEADGVRVFPPADWVESAQVK